jgi:hypothetical protein
MISVPQLMAQTTDPATAMESHGKIYVVLAVCLTILAGIVIYLIRIDRKVSHLEKKND